MCKIFLTGVVGVGKSTVIDRALEALPFSKGGIRTARLGGGSEEPKYVLTDWMTGARCEMARGRPSGLEVDGAVFETVGARAIRRAVERAELVLLDELGWMEAEAPEFQRQVFAALGSPKRVLGAIRADRNPFLDAVRKHPRVEVLEVTEGNRDALVDTVVGKLTGAGSGRAVRGG